MGIQIVTRERAKELDSRISMAQAQYYMKLQDAKAARHHAAAQVAREEGCTRAELESELGKARNSLFPREDRNGIPVETVRFVDVSLSASEPLNRQGRRIVHVLRGAVAANGVNAAGAKMAGPKEKMERVRSGAIEWAKKDPVGKDIGIRTSVRGNSLWVWTEPNNGKSPTTQNDAPPPPTDSHSAQETERESRDGMVDVLCAAIKGGASPTVIWALANARERQEIFEVIAGLLASK